MTAFDKARRLDLQPLNGAVDITHGAPGGLLFAELKKYGSLDVPRFLVRRMLRIWPPYYILLVVVLFRTAALPGGRS